MEDEQKKYLATYKFYDKRSRRLAIFATVEKVYPYLEQSDEVELHIYVITCSERDRFSKKRARQIYEGRVRKGGFYNEFMCDVADHKRTKLTFIKWCEEHYYKQMDATFQFEAKVFVKGHGDNTDFLAEFIPVTQPKPVEKEEWLQEEEGVKHGV